MAASATLATNSSPCCRNRPTGDRPLSAVDTVSPMETAQERKLSIKCENLVARAKRVARANRLVVDLGGDHVATPGSGDLVGDESERRLGRVVELDDNVPYSRVWHCG